MIVIGEVKALNLQQDAATQPLLYFKGQYHNIAGHCVV
jgi:3-hydroxy-9,10-secoandrosta-1,3,5(10)-triene-9,17-dione monooxygenase reductase component